MQNRISVIAIDIPSRQLVGMESHPDLIKYMPLNADEKAERMVAQIEKIMSALEEKEPDVLHIITWREYGLGGSNSRFITVEEKNRIKERFSELAKKYPTLVIISGTLASVKHFRHLNAEKHAEIKDEYTKSKTDKEDFPFKAHLKKVDAALNKTGVNVLRNSCFIFQGQTTQRHDKTTPHYDEISDYQSELKNAIFRPGKSKTENPVIEVTHPHTNDKISIGIEICYEHALGTLKSRNQLQPLDIHIVISDHTSVKLHNACSNNLVYVDSVSKPILIHNHESPKENNVTFYSVDGINEPTELTQPIDPIYPFETKVSTCIHNAIEKYPDGNTRNALIKIKNDWVENSSSATSNQSINDELQITIEQLQKLNSESKQNTYWMFALFQSYSPIEVLLKELTAFQTNFQRDNQSRMRARKDTLSLRPASEEYVLKNRDTTASPSSHKI